MLKVADLPVGIRYTGKDRNVFIIVEQILFPDFNRLVILIQRLVTVGESEKGVIVSGMVVEAAPVVFDCILIIALLPRGVAYPYQGIVVVFIYLDDLVKMGDCFGNSVFFKKLVSSF
jgi:hypothetical protein